MSGYLGGQPTNVAQLRTDLKGYESAIRDAFAPMVLDPESPGKRYAWSVSGKRCGTLELSHIYANGPISAKVPNNNKSPATNKVILAFVADGMFEFEQCGRRAVCGPQSLVLMDVAQPLEARQQGPVDFLSVTIDRDVLKARIPRLEQVCTHAVSSESGAAAVLRDLVKSSWRESPAMNREQALVMPQMFASMIYSVFVGGFEKHGGMEDSEKLTRFRNLIQHVIDDELRNAELGPRLIADRLGISKSYLFVVARKLNISIQQWIIDCRLDACRAALRDPEFVGQTITDIAFGSGFKDAAHFSRRFSQRFKLSPKEFRDSATKNMA